MEEAAIAGPPKKNVAPSQPNAADTPTTPKKESVATKLANGVKNFVHKAADIVHPKGKDNAKEKEKEKPEPVTDTDKSKQPAAPAVSTNSATVGKKGGAVAEVKAKDSEDVTEKDTGRSAGKALNAHPQPAGKKKAQPTVDIVVAAKPPRKDVPVEREEEEGEEEEEGHDLEDDEPTDTKPTKPVKTVPTKAVAAKVTDVENNVKATKPTNNTPAGRPTTTATTVIAPVSPVAATSTNKDAKPVKTVRPGSAVSRSGDLASSPGLKEQLLKTIDKLDDTSTEERAKREFKDLVQSELNQDSVATFISALSSNKTYKRPATVGRIASFYAMIAEKVPLSGQFQSKFFNHIFKEPITRADTMQECANALCLIVTASAPANELDQQVESMKSLLSKLQPYFNGGTNAVTQRLAACCLQSMVKYIGRDEEHWERAVLNELSGELVRAAFRNKNVYAESLELVGYLARVCGDQLQGWQEVMPTLLEAVKSDKPSVRYQALESLEDFALHMPESTSELERYQKQVLALAEGRTADRDPDVRDIAKRAKKSWANLGRIEELELQEDDELEELEERTALRLMERDELMQDVEPADMAEEENEPPQVPAPKPKSVPDKRPIKSTVAASRQQQPQQQQRYEDEMAVPARSIAQRRVHSEDEPVSVQRKQHGMEREREREREPDRQTHTEREDPRIAPGRVRPSSARKPVQEEERPLTASRPVSSVKMLPRQRSDASDSIGVEMRNKFQPVAHNAVTVAPRSAMRSGGGHMTRPAPTVDFMDGEDDDIDDEPYQMRSSRQQLPSLPHDSKSVLNRMPVSDHGGSNMHWTKGLNVLRGMRTSSSAPSSAPVQGNGNYEEASRQKQSSESIQGHADILRAMRDLKSTISKGFLELDGRMSTMEKRVSSLSSSVSDLQQVQPMHSRFNYPRTSIDQSQVQTVGPSSEDVRMLQYSNSNRLQGYSGRYSSPVDQSYSSDMIPAARRSAYIPTVWDSAVDQLQRGRVQDAYNELLKTGDDLYLLRLMHQTGPVIDRLEPLTAAELIRRLLMMLRTNYIHNVSFSWLNQAFSFGMQTSLSMKEAKQLGDILYDLSASPSKEGIEAAKLYSQLFAYDS
eukprot:GILJ01006909.1.p1 GENE.GILJ01006909.1~~GILJ01006909.1.p1  ORF type:complete len:1100 (+),score=209.95 GILJ01006909.1:361-3660(+)